MFSICKINKVEHIGCETESVTELLYIKMQILMRYKESGWI